MKRKGWVVAALLGSVAAGCGSSSSGEAPAAPPATFTDVYAMMFPLGTKGQCNYCHDRPANQKSDGNLPMGHDQATAYAAIVNQPSKSTTCGGSSQLVVPGKPDESLFYVKLTANYGCGDRMPQGGDPLTDAQLAMVRSWIEAGAKND